MGVVILPSRSLDKQSVDAQIDWSHPLSDGLKFCFLMAENAGRVYDLVDNARTIIYGSVGARQPSPYGMCANILGGAVENTDLYGLPHSNKFAITGAITNLCLAKTTIDLATTKWYPVVAHETSSTYQACLGSIYLVNYLGTFFITMYRGNGVDDYYSLPTNSGNQNGIWNQMGFVDPAGTGTRTAIMYRNGRSQMSSSISAVVADANVEYRIGGITYNGVNTNHFVGLIAYNYIWNRALTANEINWLYSEPYCFLQPVVRKFYSEPGPDRMGSNIRMVRQQSPTVPIGQLGI